MKNIYTFLCCFFISNSCLFAQATLTADGPGNTYSLITSVLGPGANPIETPDCSHPAFGPHIDEVWDADLGAFAFAFHMHTNEDDDRCINFDRQRNEIKTYDQSPDSLLGVIGETVIYKWKFKLDAGFQPSSSFTHIHQLKAVGGTEAAMPQITFTLRTGNPDRLELRYAQTNTQVTIATADLALFKGVWIDVTETVTYGEPGIYNLSMVKVSDGSPVFSYSDPSIRMWKTNADFIRPKWGIYRSLNDVAALRDETVHYADFSIEEVAGQMQNFPAGTGEVIITEYHNRPLKPTQAQLDVALLNNPTGADLTPNEGHTEWFEIYNTTNAPVVMDGWTLTDASSSSNVTTISSFTIPANCYAVFSGFDIPAAQGGVVFDYFYDYKKPSFNNESSYADPGDSACPDGVIINKADGTLVDEVRYDYGYGEYIGNASSGISCRDNTAAIGIPPAGGSSKISFMLNVDPAVMNAVDNDVAANWTYSTLVYDAAGNQKGTPGLANDGTVCSSTPVAATGTGEVIITEYHNRPQKPTQAQLDAALPNNPAGADVTPNEGHTEWFEIYNTTNAPVVMDGWSLIDGSNGNTSIIGNFTIPANCYAVFSGFDIPDAQGGVQFDYFYEYKRPSFNNESSYADPGDTNCPDGVTIEKADGTLVDQVLYDYGYGEYIGNPGASSRCRDNTTPYGIPPQNGNSKISFMLNVDPAIMNAVDNDLAANWSFSTMVYDPTNNQLGTPGLANDGTACAPVVDPCLPDLVLSGANTTTGLEEAEFTISSTEIISSGAAVEYSAGMMVNLNTGFEVQFGSELHAYILGCN